MKKIIIPVLSIVLTLFASAAFAVPFSITYTADNSLTGFTYSENGGAATDVPGFVDEGATGDWKTPASLSFNMDTGSSYELVWTVQNYSGSGANPMAFLADVSGTFGSASTSAIWEVAYDDGSGNPTGWTTATEYALNSGAWLTGASGNSIWYSSNGNSAIAGISGDARWIGFGEYPGTLSSTTMYVRLSYTATPIPAAVWLFGSGLVGLFGLRRVRRS